MRYRKGKCEGVMQRHILRWNISEKLSNFFARKSCILKSHSYLLVSIRAKYIYDKKIKVLLHTVLRFSSRFRAERSDRSRAQKGRISGFSALFSAHILCLSVSMYVCLSRNIVTTSFFTAIQKFIAKCAATKHKIRCVWEGDWPIEFLLKNFDAVVPYFCCFPKCKIDGYAPLLSTPRQPLRIYVHLVST